MNQIYVKNRFIQMNNYQMTDEQIIKNGYYELDLLKNKICAGCGNNFRYLLHKNKKIIKRKDFAYYELYGNNNFRYIHVECSDALFEKYVNEHGDLNIDGMEVKKIHLYNRYGQQMTKVNYIRDIDEWLYDAVLDKFCEHVRHMYTTKESLTSRYTDYNFDDTKIDEFNLAKNNFTYKGRRITDDYGVSKEYVGYYLARYLC